jgi:hypothetical protein
VPFLRSEPMQNLGQSRLAPTLARMTPASRSFKRGRQFDFVRTLEVVSLCESTRTKLERINSILGTGIPISSFGRRISWLTALSL